MSHRQIPYYGAFLLAALLTTKAQVSVVDTLSSSSAPSEYSLVADPTLQTKSRQEWAQAFNTPNSALTLSEVRLSLRQVVAPAGHPVSTFQVRILSDNGGQPGTTLLTLNGPDDPIEQGVGAEATILYTGSMALNPNTTYWLNATDNTLGRYGWKQATAGNAINTGSGTLGPQAQGEIKFNPSDPYWELSPSPSDVFLFSITAIPEPGLSAVGAAAAATLFFLIRRHRLRSRLPH